MYSRNFVRSMKFILYLEFKSDPVDWQFMISSKVLPNSSKEGMREEKSREPKHVWNLVLNPSLKEFQSATRVIQKEKIIFKILLIKVTLLLLNYSITLKLLIKVTFTQV